MVHSLLHAKYPIIRVNHIRLKHIKFDISIADRYCTRRNQLINEYVDYFWYEHGIPMKKLIVFIKHWTKQRGINNAYRCFLNSFGFTLLIIQFIQCLIANKDKNYFGQKIDYFAYEFWAFYAFEFDPSKHGIAIRNEQLGKKKNIGCFLEVIDPVNDANNVGQNVGYWQYSKIRAECMRCIEIYRDYSKEWKMSLFDVLTFGDYEEVEIASNQSNDHSTVEEVSVESGYSSNDADSSSNQPELPDGVDSSVEEKFNDISVAVQNLEI